MNDLIINAIFVWVVLFISLKIIKRGDVIKNSRFYVSIIGITVITSLLNKVLLFLFFTPFIPLVDVVSDPVGPFLFKDAVLSSFALLISVFSFLFFVNKLSAKQSFFAGIIAGLFANSANYLLLLYLSGIRLFPFF